MNNLAYNTGTIKRTDIVFSNEVGSVVSRYLARSFGGSRGKAVVIYDKRIEMHARALIDRLRTRSCEIAEICFESTEYNKSGTVYLDVVEQLVDRDVDRSTVVVAVGGGMVKDFAGFVAATLLRGVDFVAIPTSLLNMCDAAIGWKQGLNSSTGKNMIGAFYAPSLIVVNFDYLRTLSSEWVSDGYAEIVKLGLASSRELLEFLEESSGRRYDADVMARAAYMAIEHKLALIEADPKERGSALALQFGHTIGHSLEVLSRFSVSHGRSVAIGMRFAQRLGHELGVVSSEYCERGERLLDAYGLSDELPVDLSERRILQDLRHCKRVLSHAELTFIISDGPGRMYERDGSHEIPVCDQAILKTLARCVGARNAA